MAYIRYRLHKLMPDMCLNLMNSINDILNIK